MMLFRLRLTQLATVFLFATSSALAGTQPKWITVTPKSSAGPMGTISVTAPGGDFKGFKVSLSKKNGTRTVEITQSGHSYRSSPGEACLSIVNGKGFSYRRCGYQVVTGKSLNIDLARVFFKWDPDRAKVDLPPRLLAVFADDGNSPDAQYNSGSVFLDTISPAGEMHLLPTGNYLIRYSGTSLFQGLEKKYSLGPLEVKDLDISPEEKRATLHLHIPHPKYPVPVLGKTRKSPLVSDYIRIIERTGDAAKVRKTYPNYSVGLSNCRTMGLMPKGSFDLVTFDDRDVDYTYRLYPHPKGAPQDAHHELAVNDVIQVLDLKPGEKLDINLETLDVDAIDGNTNGFYRVWALAPGDNDEIKQGIQFSWIGKTQSTYSCATRYPDTTTMDVDPFTKQPITGRTFPTRTSFHLLPGWKYVVKSIIQDELGDPVEQSRDEVDLTPKP